MDGTRNEMVTILCSLLVCHASLLILSDIFLLLKPSATCHTKSINDMLSKGNLHVITIYTQNRTATCAGSAICAASSQLLLDREPPNALGPKPLGHAWAANY